MELNHTIVAAVDAQESATFLSEVLGLPAPVSIPPFLEVKLPNGVGLDFLGTQPHQQVHAQHYAFLVTEDEFDEVFARIVERGLTYWADPHRQEPMSISTDHGRQAYFEDPSGHLLEILTVPYA
jgi:catechol 2,3-dioxygenase-like lactoylglutathione lyase family enzyme